LVASKAVLMDDTMADGRELHWAGVKVSPRAAYWVEWMVVKMVAW
jgi:hypothetical protein